MRSLRQLTAVGISALLTGALIPVSALSAEGCSPKDAFFERGDWRIIKTPTFANDVIGSPTVLDYAVDSLDPERIFVTNGHSIEVSRDGGCSWHTSFAGLRPQEGIVHLPPDRITDIELVPGVDVVIATLGSPVETDETGELSLPTKRLEQVGGPGVLLSIDDGASWDPITEGMPTMASRFHTLRAGVSDSRHVYYMLATTESLDEPPVTVLMSSVDGGRSWAELTQGSDPSPRAQNAPDWTVPVLEVDPRDPRRLWAGGDALYRSDDGGRTWSKGSLPAPVVAIDIASTSETMLASAGGDLYRSTNAGRDWRMLETAPVHVASIAQGPGGEVMVATDDAAGRRAYALRGGTWVNVSRTTSPRGCDCGNGAYEAAASANSDPETFYFNNPEGHSLERYVWPSAGVQRARNPDNPVPLPGADDECMSGNLPDPGPGKESSAGASVAGPMSDAGVGAFLQTDETPIPEDTGPIYVSNFDTGCLVVFDRFGRGTTVASIALYSEGIAFDPIGRVVISTRFSGLVARYDPSDGAVDVLNEEVGHPESPTFDMQGNLYVVDNRDAIIYMYPWPQFPGQEPQTIASFDFPTDSYCSSRGRLPCEDNFVEDIRIAPEASPYAGDLFVQFQNSGILRLHRGDDGVWTRHDFFRWPEDFGFSIGMAFLPSGELLVIETSMRRTRDGGQHPGPQRILKVAATGKDYTVFAGVRPEPNQNLTKIDVTVGGFAYITSSYEGPAQAVAGRPRSYNPLNQYDAGETIRLDPDGRRLFPDLTDGLSYPVGIAVPNVITGVSSPDIPVEPPPAPLGPALLPPGPPPPPPLVPALPPAVEPFPVPAPHNAPIAAEVPASVPQSVANTNPQAAPVRQRQEQAQMAFVHAARQLKEQANAEYAMSRVNLRPRDPLQEARYAAAVGAASVMLLFGYSLTFVRALRSRQVRWK